MEASMYSRQVFIEIMLLLAALFSILNYIVYIIYRTRQSPLMVVYITGQTLIMAIIGTLIYIRISSTQLSSVFNFVIAVLLSYMTYFFILFAYQYFTRITLTIKKIMLMSLIPLGLMTALGINIFVYKYIQNQKSINLLNMIVSIIFSLIFLRGILYFYQYRSDARRSFKMRQSLFFSISFLKPLSIMALVMFYMAGKDPFAIIIALPILFIGVHFAGIHFQLIDDVPKLLDYVIDHMKDGIVIVDNDDNIIDYNKMFFNQLFDISECENLDDLMHQFHEIITDKTIIDNIKAAVARKSPDTYLGEMEIVRNVQLYRFNYNVSLVQDRKQKNFGMMITFHDITEIQALYQAIEEKNRVLIRANNQLGSHMENVNQLYVEEERKKLMDEINDTLGHSMTEVLALLELAVLMIDKNNEDSTIMKVLEDTTGRARLALEEIRTSIARYKE